MLLRFNTFSNESTHQKLYVYSESLPFSTFQHKVMGKLCDLGKIRRKHVVLDKNSLENTYNFRIIFREKSFFSSVIKNDTGEICSYSILKT